MTRTRGFIAGAVMCGLLGAFDVVSTLGAGSDEGPPLWVALGGCVLGIVTLVGLWFAWHGSRPAINAVVTTRGLSALLAVPVFFVDDVPSGWVPVAAVCIALTVIGVRLLLRPAPDRALATLEPSPPTDRSKRVRGGASR
jgi:hypothetical protein